MNIITRTAVRGLQIGPIQFSAAHRLPYSYSEKCSNMHGHNYKVQVTLETTYPLDATQTPGMLIDASVITEVIQRYDHMLLNEVMSSDSTTAENIAATLGNYILMKVGLNFGPDKIRDIPELEGYIAVTVKVFETDKVCGTYAVKAELK